MKRQAKRKRKVIGFFITSILFAGIAAAVAIVGLNYVVNQNFKENFYSVSSLKVNNKIRIIQISDLHNCSYGADNSQLIERVEKLKPDIILYTGDCIEAGEESTDKIVSLCERLAKVAPSYYIYGNNEVLKYYADPLTQESLDAKFGFDDSNRDPQKLLETKDALEEQLEAVGVKVLKNSMETVTIGTTNVDIYGVLTSNPSSFWSYAGQSFGDYLYNNENHLKITAIHEPFIYDEYEPDYWGDLSLAGHTHGGVARIPLIGPAYTKEHGILPEKKDAYVYGRYEVQGRPLIVNAGLENGDVFRLNNQPEIVIVDINKF